MTDMQELIRITYRLNELDAAIKMLTDRREELSEEYLRVSHRLKSEKAA